MSIRKFLNQLMFLMSLIMALDLVLALVAYAQDGTVPASQGLGAKILGFINLILPALWATAGPALVVMLTATANNLAKLYIPRALQIPLAGVLGAIVAGLTGDQASSAVVGLASGTAVQAALSMSPDKFLAGAPPPK